MQEKIIDTVALAYIEAAAFTDFGADSDIPSDADFAPEAVTAARNTCAAFLRDNEALALQYVNAGKTWDAFGHDLWFTRNHHGVGFWDRGLGDIGRALTEAAHKIGETWTYQADDGFVNFS